MLTDLDFELEPLFPYRISSIFIEWISPTGIYPPKRIGLCIPPPPLYDGTLQNPPNMTL